MPLGSSLASAANYTDASASVYPMPTGYFGAPASDHPVPLTLAELVHFNLFLSFFFVFSFAWPFCIIPGIYNYSLHKFISLIDCVVTQSPKSQNNNLMGPFSLQLRVPFQWCSEEVAAAPNSRGEGAEAPARNLWWRAPLVW